MNKEEAKKQIEQWQTLLKGCYENVDNCKSKIDELQAIINKPDRWQDSLVRSDNEQYFYLIGSADEGLVVDWYWEAIRKPEHTFKTEEQAELIKEKTLLMWEMHAFAHVRNEGWMPDWQDAYQIKWGLSYNGAGQLRVFRSELCNDYIFGIVVKSDEIAKEMLEIFGERIEKFYNKMY